VCSEAFLGDSKAGEGGVKGRMVSWEDPALNLWLFAQSQRTAGARRKIHAHPAKESLFPPLPLQRFDAKLNVREQSWKVQILRIQHNAVLN